MAIAKTGVPSRPTAAARNRRNANKKIYTGPVPPCLPDPQAEASPAELDPRSELSVLLRTWRKRRTPEDFPDQPQLKHRRRRSRHLTVEDVASLADVSLAWYRSLEAAEPNGYSPDILERIAATLRLNNAERAVMIRLATGHEPIPLPPGEREPLSPGLRTCLDSQIWPAYVIDKAGNILARNRHTLAWFPTQHNETSLVKWLFCNPAAREQFVDWPQVARNTLAHLRAQHARTPLCPRLKATLSTLLEESDDARAMWNLKPEVSSGEDGRTRKIRLPAAPAPTEVEVIASTLDRRFDVRIHTFVPVGGHLPTPDSNRG